jgi:hypothetical protein
MTGRTRQKVEAARPPHKPQQSPFARQCRTLSTRLARRGGETCTSAEPPSESYRGPTDYLRSRQLR